ncbi:response regulator transcription factor [Baekduia soli]|uniref:Response regulator transcription factor n=1 Tax=Baekduia soli TaxID=496014 RepID=A0A5B8U5M3_9ACTN|nr:response regulator transcription factor [Baekduia soli]QEC48287.1 response regulator transcription factor [Baekduia soli]
MIRIMLVDDHPAMRAGLTGVLTAEPGMVPLGAAASAAELLPVLNRTRPDVVLLDYHLPDTDGLLLCRRLKREIPAPAVLLYSAYADAQLALPAILAGADGLLHKSAPAPALYDAIRCVARGERVMPPVPRELLTAASAKVEAEDLPLIGMALDGALPDDMAAALRCDATEIAARVDAILERLRVEVPTIAP